MASKSITPRQFANRTKRTLENVYSRIWSGRIPAKQVNGRWQIQESEVQKVLKKQAERNRGTT